MPSVAQEIVYGFLFLSLYFEVFLLITYIENKRNLKVEDARIGLKPKAYPTVSIIVPCWNEEKTLSSTVHSLLNLDYPRNKLDILIVDDGSTDGTLALAKTFEQWKNVRVFTKENGGKHTALNFGLSQSQSDLVGCLDADSYVDKDALTNIVIHFEHDTQAMVVTPSMKIWQPQNIIQFIQSIEYTWSVFLRKIHSYLGAMYVTPGPFSIFKREVFTMVGVYKKAHQTEDMEMAMRLQSRGLKIVNCHNAFVYTTGPETLKKLYKQRVRWTYGFIKNAMDYKFMFFKKKYGNLGLFILPLAALSIVTTTYSVALILVHLGSSLVGQVVKIQTVGFHIHLPDILHWNFDWFYMNTNSLFILEIAAFVGLITILFISRNLAKNKERFGMDLIYFLTLYSFLAPIWLFKATYNAVFSVRTSWR